MPAPIEDDECVSCAPHPAHPGEACTEGQPADETQECGCDWALEQTTSQQSRKELARPT